MEDFFEHDKWLAMRWTMFLTNLGVVSCKYRHHANLRECATENDAHICGKCVSAECKQLSKCCTYYIRFITYKRSTFKCGLKGKFAELIIFYHRWRHSKNLWSCFKLSRRDLLNLNKLPEKEWILSSVKSASNDCE